MPGWSFIWDARYRAPRATYPEVWRTEPARTGIAPGLLPYLVLLRVGFALPPSSRTARCALTAPFHPYPACAGRYVFCGTGRRLALKPASRTLSGTLLCGVRTFLPVPTMRDRATTRSDYLHVDYRLFALFPALIGLGSRRRHRLRLLLLRWRRLLATHLARPVRRMVGPAVVRMPLGHAYTCAEQQQQDEGFLHG